MQVVDNLAASNWQLAISQNQPLKNSNHKGHEETQRKGSHSRGRLCSTILTQTHANLGWGGIPREGVSGSGELVIGGAGDRDFG